MRQNKLIQFYLTNVCNSHCKTCGIWRDNSNNIELPLQNVLDVIKEFPEADYVFGGGEAILYSKIGELLSYCNEHNISYTLLSNAVDVEALDRVIELYNVKNLTMSCDGVNHDWIRGSKGNLGNIARIVFKYKNKKYGPMNIKLSYTLSAYNEETINMDMEMIKNVLGFDKVYFCLAQDMDLLLVNKQKQIKPTKYAIDHLITKYGHMLYDKDYNFLKHAIILGDRKCCDSTSSVFTIYTNGDIVRCQSIMSKDVIGNIVNGDDFKDVVSKIESTWAYECPYDDMCNLVCQRRYD